jgi:hypothetical protein
MQRPNSTGGGGFHRANQPVGEKESREATSGRSPEQMAGIGRGATVEFLFDEANPLLFHTKFGQDGLAPTESQLELAGRELIKLADLMRVDRIMAGKKREGENSGR